MAKRKAKAGKQKSRSTRKASAPKAPEQQYPCNVLVSKGAEKIPVQVKDAARHAQLRQEFGEANVEVQK